MTVFSPVQIDRRMLLTITEARYYERGLAYAEDDRVSLLAATAHTVEAEVAGSEVYTVRLCWRDGALDGECDCPIGEQGEFCKHQVATALVWARAGADGRMPPSGGATPVPTPRQELRQWLSEQTPQTLQALLLDAAECDPTLHQWLLSRAQIASAPPQDWRKVVSALLGRKRFMDNRDSIAYAKRLRPLNALLEQAQQRDPAAALDLHEYAFDRLLTIYADCDDSSGHIGERLRALAHLHPRFAHSATPRDLAKRLFDLRLRDEWGLLPPLRDYAALLGPTGIATLEHHTLHALHDADARSHDVSDAAEALLEEIAHCGGDVQRMLDWFAQRCDSGWTHLEMARRCAEHGRARQAIEWLERGVKAHPDEPRLFAALADAYMREGFPEDALQLRWNAYVLQPFEGTYLALRETAQTLGCWEQWRERALQALDGGTSRIPTRARDLRIVLLLAEGQAQRALELARDHLHTLTLDTLACLLTQAEALDPATSLAICDSMTETAIARTNRQGYLIAIDLLQTRQRLCRELGDPDGFAIYCDRLRQRYHRKRSFIELLDTRLSGVVKRR
jgi:tetratricopeptide (TPR) repeat protein